MIKTSLLGGFPVRVKCSLEEFRLRLGRSYFLGNDQFIDEIPDLRMCQSTPLDGL
jgi:hypothetical protein